MEGDEAAPTKDANMDLSQALEQLPCDANKSLLQKPSHYECSDSGVDTIDYQRALSTSSQDFETSGNIVRSNASSVISLCSNYDEAYNILKKKNSLLNDTIQVDSATSENGSETSSINGAQTKNVNRQTISSTSKKKLHTEASKTKSNVQITRHIRPNMINPERRVTNNSQRSVSQNRAKPIPNTLELKKETTKRPPRNDSRWLSGGAKAQTVMSRSLKGNLETNQKVVKKTIETYATLPRKKRDKSAPPQEEAKSRVSLFRDSSKKTCTPLTVNNKTKARASHTIETQTVDLVEDLGVKLEALAEKYEALKLVHKSQSTRLTETEDALKQERLEKQSLRVELVNSNKIINSILGVESSKTDQEDTPTTSSSSSDSLIMLETRFEKLKSIIVEQAKEISRLNNFCRSFQIDLEKSLVGQKMLVQQRQEMEDEHFEMQEFMQAEKMTLTDALNETESEMSSLKESLSQKCKSLKEKQTEYANLQRFTEQLDRENMLLQTKFRTLEAKSKELVLSQNSTAIALSSLVERLNGLVEELLNAYNISDKELEDVIFHNEAYNHSVVSTPETCHNNRSYTDDTPSPRGTGSSFVSAVINAIRNAASQNLFSNVADRDYELQKHTLVTDDSSSNEMLDSETEPCLMMEHVLEDVVIPDGHSHNMVSSGHGSMLNSCSRLSQSESLKDFSHAKFLGRRLSEHATLNGITSLDSSFTSDMFASFNAPDQYISSSCLVDQVIDVDNTITRLLKVIRIIQIENDDYMNELHDQKDCLTIQVDKQKETIKIMVKQLKDWEVLAGGLKREVHDLLYQMKKKNSEIDGMKSELNQHRQEVEKLNQDVCELSTTLSKVELKDSDVKDSEERLREIDTLNERLADTENRLQQTTQTLVNNKQAMAESVQNTFRDTKRQYEAIDNALEILHSIQPVVQQCPTLSKLQKVLEEVNFEIATTLLPAQHLAMQPLPSECSSANNIVNILEISTQQTNSASA